MKTTLLTLIALMGLSTNAIADITHSAPAVSGYDVVSYHTAKRPSRGNGHFVSAHDGATFIFASAENKATFDADPDRFVPAFGGYCAFGVSVGKKFIGDPEVFRVIDGRTYLNLDVTIQSEWLKDVPGRIKTANSNWIEIENKDAASL